MFERYRRWDMQDGRMDAPQLTAARHSFKFRIAGRAGKAVSVFLGLLRRTYSGNIWTGGCGGGLQFRVRANSQTLLAGN
jgi:hypothetical protein